MRRPTKRALVVSLSAFTAVVVGSAGAYAYWTTTGSGTGSAKTGTSQPVTVTQLNAGTTPVNMTPGGAAQYIEFRITNPMTTPQKVGTVTASLTAGSVKYGASWGADTGVTADGRHGDVAHPCSTSDFSIVTATKAINAEVASGNTDYTGGTSGLQIQLLDAAYNQDDCKDVTVGITFSVSAGS